MVKKKSHAKHTSSKVEHKVKHNPKEVKHVVHKHKAKNNSVFWKISAIVFFVAFLLFLILFASTPHAKNVTNNGNAQKIANETVQFIQDNFPVKDVKLVSVTEDNGLYKMSMTIQDSNFEMYTSEDGELIFIPGAPVINKTEFLKQKETEKTDTNNTPTNQKLEKSDKPVIDLFVMSYCPYGTQIEKGILPVIDLLGNKIDFNLKFVYYSMHGLKEINENVLEYCMQKEQPAKLDSYLSCFLSDSNSDRCLADTNISKDSLQSCIAQTDKDFNVMSNFNDKSSYVSGQFPLFSVDAADNTKYKVQGSPTLVINGTTVDTARDSQSLLNTICDAFTNKPSECNTQLDSTSPSPGFGYNTTTQPSNSGSCS